MYVTNVQQDTNGFIYMNVGRIWFGIEMRSGGIGHIVHLSYLKLQIRCYTDIPIQVVCVVTLINFFILKYDRSWRSRSKYRFFNRLFVSIFEMFVLHGYHVNQLECFFRCHRSLIMFLFFSLILCAWLLLQQQLLQMIELFFIFA